MVNDFMVCVDRIIASAACLSSAHELERNSSSISGQHHHHLLLHNDGEERESESGTKTVSVSSLLLPLNGVDGVEGGEGCSKKEVRECRICQEEDDEHSLEAPCACNGTLKFAHRMCIQKWCNKKGDITCEICSQVFTPNYSAPPPRPNPDVMAVDIRQAWGHHFGFRDHEFLALAAAERRLLESEYDEYAVANAGNVTCLRSVAIILMFVLLIHQVLMITRDFGLMQGYSTLFHLQVSVLQLAGFLLPCYVLARSWYILHNRRRRQG